MHPLLKFML